MSSIPPPPREQLCNRYCSNKHTPPPWVGSRSPDVWDQIPRWAGGWACTSHPGVLDSIPKREEPGKTGRHPVLKYRVPDGSQCVMGRLVHTGFGSSSLIAHVLHYPLPPHANSFVLGPAVIKHTPCKHTPPLSGLLTKRLLHFLRRYRYWGETSVSSATQRC
jgi:hypothetical protein